jgi:hypothetical protein
MVGDNNNSKYDDHYAWSIAKDYNNNDIYYIDVYNDKNKYIMYYQIHISKAVFEQCKIINCSQDLMDSEKETKLKEILHIYAELKD